MSPDTGQPSLTPPGDGELSITRDGHRIAIVGAIRTPADRECLRERVNDAIVELGKDRPELVIDIGGAKYFDVALLTLLCIVARKCVDVGMTLALENVNEDLRTQLSVTKIDQVLGVHGARIAKPSTGETT